VTLHSKIKLRKVKICWFGSGKWFWLSKIAGYAVAGKRHTNPVHLQKRV
jgi:hypothetical protein